MSTLIEIEEAAEALPLEQKKALFQFLSLQLHPSARHTHPARVVREGDDAVLEAPAGAPPMTPDNIKRILEDWP